nr:hypothetical protein RP007_01071 [Rhizobium sp. P007]
MSEKPTHDVLTASNLNKRRREENDHLRKIGAAWAHSDGKGFTLQLFALPMTGRLVLREPLPDDEREREDERRMNSGNYGHDSRGR